MNQQSLLYGIGGLLIGAIIVWTATVTAVNNNNTGMMNMMGMHLSTTNQGMMHDDDMTMSQMASTLQNKTGDDFDKAFLSEMIAHHEGAINMAKLAKTNAKHQELKDLANDILSAQSQEIDKMQTWQSDWHYKNVPTSHNMMNTN